MPAEGLEHGRLKVAEALTERRLQHARHRPELDMTERRQAKASADQPIGVCSPRRRPHELVQGGQLVQPPSMLHTQDEIGVFGGEPFEAGRYRPTDRLKHTVYIEEQQRPIAHTGHPMATTRRSAGFRWSVMERHSGQVQAEAT